MQQVFDTNLEKAKLESDTQIQQLKLEIADLNSKLAKQEINLAGATQSADNVGNMEETVRVCEQKFEDKVKEVTKL